MCREGTDYASKVVAQEWEGTLLASSACPSWELQSLYTLLPSYVSLSCLKPTGSDTVHHLRKWLGSYLPPTPLRMVDSSPLCWKRCGKVKRKALSLVHYGAKTPSPKMMQNVRHSLTITPLCGCGLECTGTFANGMQAGQMVVKAILTSRLWHIPVHRRMCVCVHIHISKCSNMYPAMYIYIYTCMYIYICIYICMCIYTYI